MKRKLLSLLLALALCAGLAAPAMAVEIGEADGILITAGRGDDDGDAFAGAADALYELGLFKGVGTNADGSPDYDLDRAPIRVEAVTLLVRLLGMETTALGGGWEIPFTDVPVWAHPYVGYAYEHGLTMGTSATTFGSNEEVSAAQYLTFVLRALGYDSSADFAWDSAWTLTDELGITTGNYSAESGFLRGDAVLVAANALAVTVKGSDKTLLAVIQENLAAAVEEPPVNPEEPPAQGDAQKLYTTIWFEFIVNKVEAVTTYAGQTAPAGGKFVVVNLTEKNIWEGMKEIPMSCYDFFLGHESFDYLYPEGPWSDAMMPEEFELAYGASVTYDIVFVVPASTNNASLFYIEAAEGDEFFDAFELSLFF